LHILPFLVHLGDLGLRVPWAITENKECIQPGSSFKQAEQTINPRPVANKTRQQQNVAKRCHECVACRK